MSASQEDAADRAARVIGAAVERALSAADRAELALRGPMVFELGVDTHLAVEVAPKVSVAPERLAETLAPIIASWTDDERIAFLIALDFCDNCGRPGRPCHGLDDD